LLYVQYTSEWDEVTRLINDQSRQKVHLFLLRYMFQEQFGMKGMGGGMVRNRIQCWLNKSTSWS
ncbi:unnamed protein product, partial [Brassica napus]